MRITHWFLITLLLGSKIYVYFSASICIIYIWIPSVFVYLDADICVIIKIPSNPVLWASKKKSSSIQICGVILIMSWGVSPTGLTVSRALRCMQICCHRTTFENQWNQGYRLDDSISLQLSRNSKKKFWQISSDSYLFDFVFFLQIKN